MTNRHKKITGLVLGATAVALLAFVPQSLLSQSTRTSIVCSAEAGGFSSFVCDFIVTRDEFYRDALGSVIELSDEAAETGDGISVVHSSLADGRGGARFERGLVEVVDGVGRVTHRSLAPVATGSLDSEAASVAVVGDAGKSPVSIDLKAPIEGVSSGNALFVGNADTIHIDISGKDGLSGLSAEQSAGMQVLKGELGSSEDIQELVNQTGLSTALSIPELSQQDLGTSVGTCEDLPGGYTTPELSADGLTWTAVVDKASSSVVSRAACLRQTDEEYSIETVCARPPEVRRTLTCSYPNLERKTPVWRRPAETAVVGLACSDATPTGSWELTCAKEEFAATSSVLRPEYISLRPSASLEAGHATPIDAHYKPKGPLVTLDREYDDTCGARAQNHDNSLQGFYDQFITSPQFLGNLFTREITRSDVTSLETETVYGTHLYPAEETRCGTTRFTKMEELRLTGALVDRYQKNAMPGSPAEANEVGESSSLTSLAYWTRRSDTSSPATPLPTEDTETSDRSGRYIDWDPDAKRSDVTSETDESVARSQFISELESLNFLTPTVQNAVIDYDSLVVKKELAGSESISNILCDLGGWGDENDPACGEFIKRLRPDLAGVPEIPEDEFSALRFREKVTYQFKGLRSGVSMLRKGIRESGYSEPDSIYRALTPQEITFPTRAMYIPGSTTMTPITSVTYCNQIRVDPITPLLEQNKDMQFIGPETTSGRTARVFQVGSGDPLDIGTTVPSTGPLPSNASPESSPFGWTWGELWNSASQIEMYPLSTSFMRVKTIDLRDQQPESVCAPSSALSDGSGASGAVAVTHSLTDVDRARLASLQNASGVLVIATGDTLTVFSSPIKKPKGSERLKIAESITPGLYAPLVSETDINLTGVTNGTISSNGQTKNIPGGTPGCLNPPECLDHGGDVIHHPSAKLDKDVNNGYSYYAVPAPITDLAAPSFPKRPFTAAGFPVPRYTGASNSTAISDEQGRVVAESSSHDISRSKKIIKTLSLLQFGDPNSSVVKNRQNIARRGSALSPIFLTREIGLAPATGATQQCMKESLTPQLKYPTQLISGIDPPVGRGDRVAESTYEPDLREYRPSRNSNQTIAKSINCPPERPNCNRVTIYNGSGYNLADEGSENPSSALNYSATSRLNPVPSRGALNDYGQSEFRPLAWNRNIGIFDRRHYFTDQFVPSSMDGIGDAAQAKLDGLADSDRETVVDSRAVRSKAFVRVKKGLHVFEEDGPYVGKLLPEVRSDWTQEIRSINVIDEPVNLAQDYNSFLAQIQLNLSVRQAPGSGSVAYDDDGGKPYDGKFTYEDIRRRFAEIGKRGVVYEKTDLAGRALRKTSAASVECYKNNGPTAYCEDLNLPPFYTVYNQVPVYLGSYPNYYYPNQPHLGDSMATGIVDQISSPLAIECKPRDYFLIPGLSLEWTDKHCLPRSGITNSMLTLTTSVIGSSTANQYEVDNLLTPSESLIKKNAVVTQQTNGSWFGGARPYSHTWLARRVGELYYNWTQSKHWSTITPRQKKDYEKGILPTKKDWKLEAGGGFVADSFHDSPVRNYDCHIDTWHENSWCGNNRSFHAGVFFPFLQTKRWIWKEGRAQEGSGDFGYKLYGPGGKDYNPSSSEKVSEDVVPLSGLGDSAPVFGGPNDVGGALFNPTGFYLTPIGVTAKLKFSQFPVAFNKNVEIGESSDRDLHFAWDSDIPGGEYHAMEARFGAWHGDTSLGTLDRRDPVITETKKELEWVGMSGYAFQGCSSNLEAAIVPEDAPFSLDLSQIVDGAVNASAYLPMGLTISKSGGLYFGPLIGEDLSALLTENPVFGQSDFETNLLMVAPRENMRDARRSSGVPLFSGREAVISELALGDQTELAGRQVTLGRAVSDFSDGIAAGSGDTEYTPQYDYEQPITIAPELLAFFFLHSDSGAGEYAHEEGLPTYFTDIIGPSLTPGQEREISSLQGFNRSLFKTSDGVIRPALLTPETVENFFAPEQQPSEAVPSIRFAWSLDRHSVHMSVIGMNIQASDPQAIASQHDRQYQELGDLVTREAVQGVQGVYSGVAVSYGSSGLFGGLDGPTNSVSIVRDGVSLRFARSEGVTPKEIRSTPLRLFPAQDRTASGTGVFFGTDIAQPYQGPRPWYFAENVCGGAGRSDFLIEGAWRITDPRNGSEVINPFLKYCTAAALRGLTRLEIDQTATDQNVYSDLTKKEQRIIFNDPSQFPDTVDLTDATSPPTCPVGVEKSKLFIASENDSPFFFRAENGWVSPSELPESFDSINPEDPACPAGLREVGRVSSQLFSNVGSCYDIDTGASVPDTRTDKSATICSGGGLPGQFVPTIIHGAPSRFAPANVVKVANFQTPSQPGGEAYTIFAGSTSLPNDVVPVGTLFPDAVSNLYTPTQSQDGWLPKTAAGELNCPEGATCTPCLVIPYDSFTGTYDPTSTDPASVLFSSSHFIQDERRYGDLDPFYVKTAQKQVAIAVTGGQGDGVAKSADSCDWSTSSPQTPVGVARVGAIIPAGDQSRPYTAYTYVTGYNYTAAKTKGLTERQFTPWSSERTDGNLVTAPSCDIFNDLESVAFEKSYPVATGPSGEFVIGSGEAAVRFRAGPAGALDSSLSLASGKFVTGGRWIQVGLETEALTVANSTVPIECQIDITGDNTTCSGDIPVTYETVEGFQLNLIGDSGEHGGNAGSAVVLTTHRPTDVQIKSEGGKGGAAGTTFSEINSDRRFTCYKSGTDPLDPRLKVYRFNKSTIGMSKGHDGNPGDASRRVFQGWGVHPDAIDFLSKKIRESVDD